MYTIHKEKHGFELSFSLLIIALNKFNNNNIIFWCCSKIW